MSRYDDIIDLPHYQSTKRPHMSLHDRGAQFAPFAALKGYEEAVAETARLTDSKLILDDNEIEQIDAKLQYISENISDNLIVSITYFVPDLRKAGGHYSNIVGSVKRIDPIAHTLTMLDNVEIQISDIYSIDIE